MADLQFEGKVAIVTGISSACAITLALGGARLVVADINEELGNRIRDQSERQRRGIHMCRRWAANTC